MGGERLEVTFSFRTGRREVRVDRVRAAGRRGRSENGGAVSSRGKGQDEIRTVDRLTRRSGG